MQAGQPLRILHVEVGGTYGGSLRALELYLGFSDRTRFSHDLLLYYPTPRAGRACSLVDSTHILYDTAPDWMIGGPPGCHDRLSGALRRSGLKRLLTSVRNWIGVLRAAPAAWRIVRYLRSHNHDVVHVNNTFTYQIPTILAAWWVRKPVIAHVRNPVPASLLNRALARLTRAIVTVSGNYERELHSWRLPVAVETCHDGVQLSPPDPCAAARLRDRFLPAGGVLIGSVGRLDRQKGYDNLVRAARIVAAARPGARFVVAGDGPMRAELEELVRQLGLHGVVQFCGFRSDVAEFIAALDLFVCSSRWEGLPIAVVEALLIGKTVIATDVGGVSEVVRPGEAGYLVPPDDVEALAASIVKALESPDDARCIERGRCIATAVTDPAKSAQRLESLISRLVSPPARLSVGEQ